MKQPIRPDTLRTLRAHRNLSQAKLAARSKEVRQKVSVATIKRIETWTETETYMANPTVAERLAKALEVGIEDLAKAPDKDGSFWAYALDNIPNTSKSAKAPKKDGSFEVHWEVLERLLGCNRRRMSVSLPQRTLFDFQMVEHLYGIPVQSQIKMAPLCMALLAEGSLAWRKKRVEEIDGTAEKLRSLNDIPDGHLSFLKAVYHVEEGAQAERESIKQRDVFGKDVSEDTYKLGYDRSHINPFSAYLREFADDFSTTNVGIEADKFSFEQTYEGLDDFPQYRIGGDLIEDLTADDAVAYHALKLGHVRLGEIPEELLGAGNTDKRVEWLTHRIPDNERAEIEAAYAEIEAAKKRRAEHSAELDLDLSEANPVKSEDNQDVS